MAEKEVSVRGKCSKLQHRNLLRRTSEFERFRETTGIRSPSTLGAMLGALSDLNPANAKQAAVLGAIVSSVASPEHTRLCIDIVCWAFAPDVNRKLQTLRRTEKTDAAQACMLGLLEALNQETRTAEENVIEHLHRAVTLLCGVERESVHPCMLGVIEAGNQMKVARAAENVIARLRRGIDIGFAHLARSERRAANTFRSVQQRTRTLKPSEIAGRRARRKERITFDEQECAQALHMLERWVSRSNASPVFSKEWIAVALRGEPIRDYLRRTSNSDREPTALECARISNSKARAAKKIRELVDHSQTANRVRQSLEIRDLFDAGI